MELNKLHQIWCLHARHVSNIAAGTAWDTIATRHYRSLAEDCSCESKSSLTSHMLVGLQAMSSLVSYVGI